MIGTLNKVRGVVTGPLKTGIEVGHLVSPVWATQTIPVRGPAANALGIIWAGTINIRIVIGNRIRASSFRSKLT